MNETIALPRWLVIAVLPTLLLVVLALFGFLWSTNAAITRIDQRGIDQDRIIKEIDTRNKLTDEHERQLEKDFAEFNGWQRGRAGEQYRAAPPRRDDRNDQPTN